MVITVTSFKGGVGKTTSAVHLAAYCQQKGPTLLVDGDPNRSATFWKHRGGGFSFDVLDETNAKGTLGRYAHVVIDTQARPSSSDLSALAGECDLLVIPSTPDVLALDALMQTVSSLPDTYRILLTIVPPKPSRAGEEVRATLKRSRWPVMKATVRRLAAFQKAALIGCLVQNVPGDQRAALGWQDYSAAGKEIMR